MIWFNHPKSAGSRKPVASLPLQSQSQPQPQPIDLDPLATRTLTDPFAGSPALQDCGGQAGSALMFSVRYTLVEYVSFMWQHARHLIRRRRIAAPASWIILLKSTWWAAFHFVMQGRARHTYEFTIDQHGIVRSGPGGVTLIKWGDVRAMRHYTRGRMLVLERGTLPIPARCLNRAQADRLAAYAASIKVIAPA